MIQLKKKLAAVAPAILSNQGVTATQLLKTEFDGGAINFEFNSGIYGHSSVKEYLKKLQDDKCCFCEAKISHVSYGDVEHFRPKAGWAQDEEPLNQPGYYWLAYDWSNLFLSCQICNQRHKKNYFPLADNARRALSHKDNINNEKPLFINPALENPETHITFYDEIPKPVNGSIRGQLTIKHTGIDRETLNENRRGKLNPLIIIYELAKGYPDTNPELRARAWATVKDYCNKCLADETEYASMYRAFFKEHPLPDNI
jgi:uncharacterized protein (TIGR02646 family)